MKKVTVMILLTYSICGFAVKWEKIAEDYDGNSIYIDHDSIEKKESRVYYSNLIDFLKTKQKSYEEFVKWFFFFFKISLMLINFEPKSNNFLNKISTYDVPQIIYKKYHSEMKYYAWIDKTI